ncbi:hypothetical protein JUJ52_08750 [Virgibacillus sp. AGTR]|nr:hypothetical protein [Virgibacillus sp. AGTR]MCC2250054.1 hypothetical protein [Virgibacillus sp. AGTR]QRZ17497.1 hypothetical protein JUJ52_17265 [Virgibacillus sp. AGTR]
MHSFMVYDKTTNETIFEANTEWECMEYMLEKHPNDDNVIIGRTNTKSE